MDKNKQFQVSAFLRDKIKDSDFLMVLKRLNHADDEAMTAILMIPFKNTVVAAMLGLFLGGWGANRFYVGAVTSGIVKLILGVVLVVLWLVPIPYSILYLPMLLILAYGIFNIIDIFLCISLAKKKNFQMVMEVITLHSVGANNTYNDFGNAIDKDEYSEILYNDTVNDTTKPIDEEDIFPDICAARAVDASTKVATEEPSVAKKPANILGKKQEDIMIQSDAVIDVSKLQNNKNNGTNKN